MKILLRHDRSYRCRFRREPNNRRPSADKFIIASISKIQNEIVEVERVAGPLSLVDVVVLQVSSKYSF